MSAVSVATGSEPDGTAFGIVQMSCGIQVRRFRYETKRTDSGELVKNDVCQIDANLKQTFGVGTEEFELANLGYPSAAKPMLCTWLGQWSRGDALGIPGIFSAPEAPGDTALPFPQALNWPGIDPEKAPFNSYVRVQRALDDPGCHDWNDRVIRQNCSTGPDERTRSMTELRDFFAWLYAQRRSAIFASNLSERIYHIWLPTGLLSHRPGDQEQGGPLVVLPLITMVRRPFKLEWRHTIGATMIFVPVHCEPGKLLTPRPLVQAGSCELKYLVRSLEGGTTRVGASAETVLQLDDCPLKEFATALRGRSRTPGLIDELVAKMGGRWEGTRRQWIEFLATIGADSVGTWDKDPRVHKRRLADAVLRSLRLTTIWSAMLEGKGLDCLEDRQDAHGPAIRQWPATPPADGHGIAHSHRAAPRQSVQSLQPQAATSADFPAWAASALDTLSEPGSPPGPEDRIDDVTCSDVDFMSWRVPRRRCLLTVMGISKEHFPGYSLLATSGWLGHMLIGAASASETMLQLAKDISRPLRCAELARTAYEVHEKIATEGDNLAIAITAAVLAIALIALTAYTGHPILNGVLVGLSVLLVLGVGVYFRRRPTRLRQ
jgi:hypothetical protein